MNLQQLEYIVAVDTHRHFTTAAARCFVTQATLSMMIRKLEHELDVVIFDRSKQPVKPTEIGAIVIAQARRILGEASNIRTLIEEHRGTVAGELHIGIIPTLAPYLLPRFIRGFTSSYPQIRLKISEMLTDDIVRKLRNGQLDGGLLATPLNEKDIREIPLFYESFLLYANTNEQVMKKKYVLPADLDVSKLLLLEEGHCMRNQLLNFCELKRAHDSVAGFDYEAGSIETLVRMVDHHQGITIIPELAALEMEKKKAKPPSPVQGPCAREGDQPGLPERISEETPAGVAAAEHQRSAATRTETKQGRGPGDRITVLCFTEDRPRGWPSIFQLQRGRCPLHSGARGLS